MTAWQLVKEGRPFTETLTTRRFVMTTALKSLYIQVEMTPDNGRTTTAGPAWTIDYSGNAIPIETALTNMTFSDEAPAITMQTGTSIACRGGAVVATGAFQGTSRLFQRLLGFTPQFPQSRHEMCAEHASKPYFTAEDVSDWSVGHHQREDEPRRSRAGDPALRPAGVAPRDRADAVAAARRLLHDARVPGAVEHQRQQPAPRHRQPDVAGRVRAGVHRRKRGHPVLDGGPGREPRGHRRRMYRLPPDAGSDAPVLGQPARLQRPQRLPGRQPQQPRQPAPHGRAGQRVRVRRRGRRPERAWATWAAS